MRGWLPQSKPARGLLWGALALGVAVRAVLVFSDEGICWPDEIYQSLEPAHRLVFGYALTPWEFIEGARNWALPGLLAVVLKLCTLLGGDSPYVYVRVAKLCFVVVSALCAAGVYRLARSVDAREWPAAGAAAAYFLCVPTLYYSHRAMSENATALPVVWGLALLLQASATRRAVLWGAALLGLAVLLRLQSGLFCVGALTVLLARKDFGRARDALLMLALWALAFGALDAVAWHDAPGAKWGGWFHSAVVYLRFNLIEGKGAAWGVAPWPYYLEHLWSTMPALSLALVAFAALSARRAPGLLAVALVFFALHSWTPHKELRFMLPVLPLFFALLAVGLSQLAEPLERPLVWALLALSALGALTVKSLTMGQLGSYPERPQSSAWDDFGPVNRLLLEASRHADVCGIRVDVHTAWAGGMTYLHRRAPMYMPGSPPQAGHFNYAVVAQGSGAEVVARDGALELVHLPMPACTPDPSYSWRLP